MGVIVYADEHGIDALSISALARHLGVAAPSLYVHLPGGLRDLRIALSVKGHRDLAEHCRRAATGRSGADALRARPTPSEHTRASIRPCTRPPTSRRTASTTRKYAVPRTRRRPSPSTSWPSAR